MTWCSAGRSFQPENHVTRSELWIGSGRSSHRRLRSVVYGDAGVHPDRGDERSTRADGMTAPRPPPPRRRPRSRPTSCACRSGVEGPRSATRAVAAAAGTTTTRSLYLLLCFVFSVIVVCFPLRGVTSFWARRCWEQRGAGRCARLLEKKKERKRLDLQYY